MIFYFSGTGNSLYAAKQIAAEGERLISIADARKKGEFVYTRTKRERVGFVYPEYCASVPIAVLDFIRRLELRGKGYVFAVVTCGGSRACSPGLLGRELKKRGIVLHYAAFVTMPDNAVALLPMPSAEKIKCLLDAAEEQLSSLRETLAEMPVSPVRGGAIATIMQPFYRWIAVTRLFHAENSCIGCGLCARNCPDQAIQLTDGRPVWVQPNCTFCNACINRCPVTAIQYGKRTASRSRYVHPSLQNNQQQAAT